MIFESIKATPLSIERESLPRMVNRKRSSANLQENKIQVVVMGSSKVGKTSMIDRLTREKIAYDEKIEITKREVQVEMIVELMDIQDNSETIMRRFAIETAHAYILMYSIDDPQSFNKIELLKDEIAKVKGHGMPMIVVGNKADLSKTKSKPVATNADGKINGDIPHIKMSLQKGRQTYEIYKQLFKHQTLKKLTDMVLKINRCTLFTDLRRLSQKAEKLEESIAMIFPPTKNLQGRSNDPKHSCSKGGKPSKLSQLKSFFL